MLTPDENDPSRPRRRASDREPGSSRSFLWGNRSSDLDLLPHSPLALADVLAHPGGCFDLLAMQPDGSGGRIPSRLGDSVEPITGARAAQRRPRARSNLLTAHSTEQLRERCRAAIVESALVRRRDERRLYLAAGFLRGPDVDAPVLLYPALLVCKSGDEGHELRIEDAVPDMNLRLSAHVRDTFDISLPTLSAQEPLSDYFARLASAVAELDGFELAFEIAIGNASSDFLGAQDDALLPDLPASFDASLAMSLASDISLEELHQVLSLMPDSATAAPARRTDAVDAEFAHLRGYSVKLASRGLDSLSFADLVDLPAKLDDWLEALQQARQCAMVSSLFAEHPLSVRQLAQLGGIIELIDKVPAGIDAARHADLAYESTSHLLQRARHQARLIEDELESLQDVFVLEKVPGKSDLLQLMDDLGAFHGGPEVVDADYFHARRQFMEFSVSKPAHLDDQDRRRLGQLVKVMRFRELFVNNTEYRRSLGAGYRGLRTDWTHLSNVVGYARELATVLGSEALASVAMQDFATFRTHLVEDLDVLRRAGDALRAAIKVIGRSWQPRNIDDAATHLAETAERLRHWQSRYGDQHEHASQTASAVLSQLTGQARRDAGTEARVRNARAQVDESLRSGRADAQIVADTLNWLRAASRRAAERQLDIGAIVDHLQIA